MIELLRGRSAIKYIIFEMLPIFFIGVVIFELIILMFQSLRLTEYVIVHGADIMTIGKILSYISISFLPVIMPMSLLFAVLLTYGRLSNDSEITAFKAIGLNNIHLSTPAIVVSVLAILLSAQTSFFIAPWGNRRMEVLLHQLGQMKPTAAIKEGVFSDLFDKVIYANKVDSKNGRLGKVFIYEDSNNPYTIIAQSGQLIQESTFSGQRAFLKLFNGNIHRTNKEVYTKVDFKTYSIKLFDPIEVSEKLKTPLSYNFHDLSKVLANPKTSDKDRTKYSIELHRRWALSFVCFIFALLGVGLGTVKNKRAARSNSFVNCIGIVISYWITYALFESFAKNEYIPVLAAMWTPNIIYLGIAAYFLKKSA